MKHSGRSAILQGNMLELSVNTKSPAAITAALKKIHEMVMSGAVAKNAPVHITLEPGSYREVIKYNLSNPLVMESTPGTPAASCTIQAENCEAFHKGAENRAVFVIGPNASNITLKNFTIVNTHNKSVAEGNTLPDAAEAFCWNNSTGTLFAEGMRFEGRQNTLSVKGYSWFLNCYVSGDTDFISGDCDTAFFENCEIHVREDNRGDFPAYAVSSRALAEKPGIVFSSCRFTGEKRRKSPIFLYRTAGKGCQSSQKDWDSMALVNCFVSDIFDDSFVWDDDMELEVYPRGNAKTGFREYNTRIVMKNGKVAAADTTRRNIKSYTLTDDDYFRGYASRYLILHDTPFAEIKD